MVQFYFKRILEKINFNFIPVFDLEDDSIYGYKIIKDFSVIGFNDKDLMYQMAFEDDTFETLVLKLLEKSFQMAIENNYIDKKLFYTLRLNYVLDNSIFFDRIHTLVSSLKLNENNIIFDIKGITDWEKFYKETKNCNFEYLKLNKEDRNVPINLNVIAQEKPELIEIRDIQNFTFIKEYIDDNIKIIFNTNTDSSLTKEELKRIGISHYYYFNKNKQFDETEL
ncbi:MULTISPECIES: hypothetical protein [Fusobacterium]|uniref:hypothetical protein n=1 Tax=Fusobacterium TaxID=848 RepID=UPI0008A5ADE7|nr:MULTISPECIES: hypothetical protein [Fusobacterium]OFL85659.1 hypothetical protein HMPREF2747_10840 [Fusobacterium sp. HMSC073F01]